MKKIIGMAVLLLAFVFGCSQDFDRKQSVDSWIAAGDKVAEKTNHEVAIIIMDFLKRSCYLITPREGNIPGKFVFEISGDVPESSYTIGITSLIKKDAELDETWKKVFESKNYAFLFIPQESVNASLLFLKDDVITEDWKGIVLLHEASHAIVHSKGLLAHIKDSELRNAINEAETYTLIDEILESLGKERYIQVLNREVSRLEKELAAGKEITARPDLYQKEMAEMFGKPGSDRETNIRADTLFFIAGLKMYDKKFTPKEATREKLEFIANTHSDRHIR